MIGYAVCFTKVVTLKAVNFLKVKQFLGNFLNLRGNYRANAQVVFNRESQLWESSLRKSLSLYHQPV